MSLGIILDYEKMHEHFENKKHDIINCNNNIYVSFDMSYYNLSLREKITKYLRYNDKYYTDEEVTEIENIYSSLYEI